MERKPPPPDPVERIGEPTSERPYRIAFWGGPALAGALALVRAGVEVTIRPAPDLVAPIWMTLGLVAGVLSGSALSLRPMCARTWFGGAVTLGLLSVGVCSDWDSIQLLTTVGASVCLIAAIVIVLPLKLRLAFFGGCLLAHFAGILSAVTSPSPQPWISGQVWTRVFRPYLHFTYMNNAYQFYSPDPGPARVLWFCIEYVPKPEFALKHPVPPANGDKGYFRWFRVPVRPEQYTDPLGQAYFRRLSISEYTAQFPQPGYTRSPVETKVIEERRTTREDIPRIPEFGVPEYQPPTIQVQKAYLPSYVQHVASINQHPEFDIRSIKFYRVTHRILGAQEFATVNGRPPVNPYDPTTYEVYFQGNFDKDGNLLNPFDPLLFWHIPIRRKPAEDFDLERMRKLIETNPAEWAAVHRKSVEQYDRMKQLLSSRSEEGFNEGVREYHRIYDDYVTIHAGFDHLRGGNLP